jgi:hypothetical protein
MLTFEFLFCILQILLSSVPPLQASIFLLLLYLSANVVYRGVDCTILTTVHYIPWIQS